MSKQWYDLGRQSFWENCQLLYVARYRFENDWLSLPHTHYCAEVFDILGGKGFFQVESQQFPLRPGDLVVVNPDTPHTELSFADNPLEYIVMGIDGVRFQGAGGGEDRYFHLSAGQLEGNYRFYLESILSECDGRRDGFLDVCAGQAQAFLVLLRRQIAQRALSPARSRSNSECGRVKRYMDEHYSENITLDTLAAQAHISKHYLIHAFNKEVGCSPISYLQARRIAEGKHLLENSSLSVREISLSLGFSSPSYFTQRFKKAVGLSPLEYRLSIRSQARGP